MQQRFLGGFCVTGRWCLDNILWEIRSRLARCFARSLVFGTKFLNKCNDMNSGGVHYRKRCLRSIRFILTVLIPGSRTFRYFGREVKHFFFFRMKIEKFKQADSLQKRPLWTVVGDKDSWNSSWEECTRVKYILSWTLCGESDSQVG